MQKRAEYAVLFGVFKMSDQRRIIFPVSDNYNSRKLLQIFVLPKQGKRLDSSEFSSLRVI